MKLKKFLPIAAVASTAAIVAPIVTACSCATAVKLDNYLGGGSIVNKEPIIIDANKTYAAIVNIDDIDEELTEEGMANIAWAFAVITDDKETSFEISDFSVQIDKTKLTEYKGEGNPGKNQFKYGMYRGLYSLMGHDGDIKLHSKIQIKLKVKADKQPALFAFELIAG